MAWCISVFPLIFCSYRRLASVHQFESAADQLILMANKNAVNVYSSFGTMAAIYPSNAGTSTETLPFVTLDGFEELAVGFRNLSKASHVDYSPILGTQDDVAKWNNYSASHGAWVARGQQGQDYGGANASAMFMPMVYQLDETTYAPIPVKGTGPFVPVWQMSPVPAEPLFVNIDAYQYGVAPYVDSVVQSGQATLTEPNEHLKTMFPQAVAGPLSALYQPVFDRLGGPDSGRKVIAVLTAYLSWKYFFDATLNTGQDNVMVVVQSCNINSTFLVNGPVAEFVGSGDLHEPKFDKFIRSKYFVGSATEESSINKQCSHIVHVFPTSALHSSHITMTPVYYAVIVVAIFAFSALVFLTYDYFVNSRQTRTEKQASHSNAIVQELFPGDVAMRLFDSQENAALESRSASAFSSSGFGKVDRSTIAELHPEATILCK
jgi:hypothetical protein